MTLAVLAVLANLAVLAELAELTLGGCRRRRRRRNLPLLHLLLRASGRCGAAARIPTTAAATAAGAARSLGTGGLLLLWPRHSCRPKVRGRGRGNTAACRAVVRRCGLHRGGFWGRKHTCGGKQHARARKKRCRHSSEIICSQC